MLSDATLERLKDYGFPRSSSQRYLLFIRNFEYLNHAFSWAELYPVFEDSDEYINAILDLDVGCFTYKVEKCLIVRLKNQKPLQKRGNPFAPIAYLWGKV